MRDLLPLLRQHPQLYAKASQQALPTHMFDYLAISPAAYNASNTSIDAAMAGADATSNNGSKNNSQVRSW